MPLPETRTTPKAKWNTATSAATTITSLVIAPRAVDQALALAFRLRMTAASGAEARSGSGSPVPVTSPDVAGW
jgi:hypothetical protein